MSTDVCYPHLVTDSSGVLRIDSTRYRASQLAAEQYHYGWSAEELLRQHPDLRPAQDYAALTWFYDHFDSVVAELRREAETLESAVVAQPLSRNQLLQRQSVRNQAMAEIR